MPRSSLAAVVGIVAVLFAVSRASGQAQPPPPQRRPAPAQERCRAYDAAHVQMKGAGDRGWIVTDGKQVEIPADTEGDAWRLVSVASAYSEFCTVPLPRGRTGYVQYFRGASKPPLLQGLEDCMSYDPQLLRIETGGALFKVTAGRHLLFTVASEPTPARS